MGGGAESVGGGVEGGGAGGGAVWWDGGEGGGGEGAEVVGSVWRFVRFFLFLGGIFQRQDGMDEEGF